MLLEAVRDTCLRLGLDRRYWVAYSGGVDSHVLLFLCAQLRNELSLNLSVIHVNHGLSQYAAAWSMHCARVCRELDLPLISEAIHLDVSQGESLEEKARDLRYEIIAKHLSLGDVLLTAHHQQDQAETFLLQLLRGAGLKGLSAMPEVKPFQDGFHARPLLSFNRDTLLTFARSHQLQWIEDDSNQHILFARNYLRHQVLPVIEARWPSAVATISRSAQHCAEAEQLLSDMAVESLLAVAGSKPNTLSVAKLASLGEMKQRWLLRAWIHQQGFRLPSQKKITTIFKSLFHSAWDKVPVVEWAGCVMRRYRDDLYLMAPLAEQDIGQRYQWKLALPLTVPGIGIMQAESVMGAGLRLDEVIVRFRQGGESVELPQRCRRTLKNLFNEWGVVPWERNRVPLLYHGDELIGVVGYWYHPDWLARESERGWLVRRVD